jgi:antitoxin component YwqK of YwqJK toxin-antitoxin module
MNFIKSIIKIIFITIILIITSCNQPQEVKTDKKVIIEYGKLYRDKGFYHYKESKELFTGKAISNYRSGEKHKEINFKDGRLDGLYILWHKNGIKKREIGYKLDRRDGKYTSWFTNGKKHFEMEYKNGRLDGLSLEWDKNGKLLSKITYKNGTRVKRSFDIIKPLDPKKAEAIRKVREIDEKEYIDIKKMEKLRKELKAKKL